MPIQIEYVSLTSYCKHIQQISQVAGALCMWIRELSHYCRAYLDSIDMEDATDDIQDKQATVEEEKVNE